MAVEIDTDAELQAMENDLTEDYVLIGNVDASDTSTWNSGAGFDPVGVDGDEFVGSFDGDGFAIDQLFIDRSGTSRVGLFGVIGNGIAGPIGNVELTSPDITGGAIRVAAFAGEIQDDVSGVTVTGGTVDGVNDVGATFGIAFFGATVDDCHNSAAVTGSDKVGGIGGETSDSGGAVTVQNCTNSGNVTGVDQVGGVIGRNGSSCILQESEQLAGDISANAEAGGVCGANSGTIRRVRSAGGTVTATASNSDVGGSLGRLDAGSIDDSYSRIPVTGVNRKGGFIGIQISGTIARDYSTGTVSSSGSHRGGFMGRTVGGTAPVDCFWDTDTSGEASDGTGGTATGKDTSEMIDVDTFTETDTVGLTNPWDFEDNPNDDAANNDYWGIQAGFNDSYPYLTAIQTPPAAGAADFPFRRYYMGAQAL